MKRVIVISGVLVLAAAAVGAVFFTMNSGAGSTAAPATASDARHDHGHDHSGHTHGPNGECPLDAATAVGVEQPAGKDGMDKDAVAPTPAVAPAKPGA